MKNRPTGRFFRLEEAKEKNFVLQKNQPFRPVSFWETRVGFMR
jgi:hypothetical protein